MAKEVDRISDKIGALVKCHDGSEIVETALEAQKPPSLTIALPWLSLRSRRQVTLKEWPQIEPYVGWLQDPSDTKVFADAIERLVDLDADEIAHRAKKLRDLIVWYQRDRLTEE